jgi:hypothetical protein
MLVVYTWKITLDFVDETPSLEDSYANSSAPEPTPSRSRPSTQQLSAKRIINQKKRRSPYATSKNGSEARTPTPSRPLIQASSPSAPNHRIDKSIEQETNESSSSGHSIIASNSDDDYEESATLTEVPQGTSHWFPRSYDPPFANASESTAPLNESLTQSFEAQSKNFEESDYWPYMTVQEAYLMRYFIDKLACWVSFPRLPGSIS